MVLSAPRPVILVVRPTDGPNETTFYNEAGQLEREVTIIDVDYGAGWLADPDELHEWGTSLMRQIRDLPHGHPAKLEVLSLIDQTYERYGADERKPSLEG